MHISPCLTVVPIRHTVIYIHHTGISVTRVKKNCQLYLTVNVIYTCHTVISIRHTAVYIRHMILHTCHIALYISHTMYTLVT